MAGKARKKVVTIAGPVEFSGADLLTGAAGDLRRVELPPLKVGDPPGVVYLRHLSAEDGMALAESLQDKGDTEKRREAQYQIIGKALSDSKGAPLFPEGVTSEQIGKMPAAWFRPCMFAELDMMGIVIGNKDEEEAAGGTAKNG